MIKCKKCGQELDNNAKFCFNCGSPVEKDNKCPSCGTVNPETAKFCITCGQPLSGAAAKPVSQVGGTPYLAAKPQVAAKPQAAVEPQAVAKPQAVAYAEPVAVGEPVAVQPNAGSKQAVFNTIDKVAKILSACLAGALAVLSIVFLFTMGVSVTSVGDGYSETVTTSIFEMISFDNLSQLIQSISGGGDGSGSAELLASAISQLVNQLLLAMAVYASIVAILIMAIIALVKWIKFSKNRDTNVSTISVKMFLTFLACSAYIGVVMTAKDEWSVSFGGESDRLLEQTGLSGLTMAGIIIGLIIIGLYIACRIYLQRKEFKANKIVLTSCVGVAFILVIVMLLVLNSGVLTASISESEDGFKESYVAAFGLMRILSEVNIIGGDMGTLLTLASSVGASMYVAFWLIFIGSSLFTVLDKGKSPTTALVFSIISLLAIFSYMSGVNTLLDLVMPNLTTEMGDSVAEMNQLKSGVVLLVLSIIVLATTITSMVMNSKVKKQALVNTVIDQQNI